MRKLLVLGICIWLANPMAATAQSLTASGQAYVFGVFGAPPPAVISWLEADGVTKLGGGLVQGPNPVCTDIYGRFTFRLTVTADFYRIRTFVNCDGIYLGGMFHVSGNSAPFNVLAGPNQSTTLTGIRIDAF